MMKGQAVMLHHAKLMGLGCLMAVGGMLMACQEPDTPPVTDVPGQPLPEVSKGQALYRQHCSMCHAASGRGTAMVPKYIRFNDEGWQADHTDEAIAAAIRTGPGTMPAYEGMLSDDDIQHLVEHIRTLAGH